MKSHLGVIFGVVVAILVVIVVTGRRQGGDPDAHSAAESPARAAVATVDQGPVASAVTDDDETPVAAEEDEDDEAAEELTEEEKREAAEERLVEAFDDLTDSWRDDAPPETITMAKIDEFVAAFRALPPSRRDECVHRALNLIPDANVMLLAGILLDRSMDNETIETVYNDILNRDEEVKKPVLKEIFKDKAHPCWTDTAWILDVTGDLPEKHEN